MARKVDDQSRNIAASYYCGVVGCVEYGMLRTRATITFYTIRIITVSCEEEVNSYQKVGADQKGTGEPGRLLAREGDDHDYQADDHRVLQVD